MDEPLDSPGKLVVVAWDGLDWPFLEPLLEAKRLPHFQRLIETGVIGKLSTLQPQVPAMQWTSLVTGVTGDRHGALGYAKLDEAGSVVATQPRDIAYPSLWETLAAYGWHGHVVGWPITHPADSIDGVNIVSDIFPGMLTTPDDWSLPGHAVEPHALADQLDELLVHPAALTAEHILPFVPTAADIDQAHDGRLQILATHLAQWSSVHNVATTLMEQDDWQFAMVRYAATARLGYTFLQYHPPQLPHVSAEELQTYGAVMMAVCQFADLQLGRLIELAGDRSTVMVVSPFGLQSGRLRPNAADGSVDARWHREHGVWIASGPGIRADEWIWGGTLLDVAPTIMRHLRLPLPQYFQGKPLDAMFTALPVPMESEPIELERTRSPTRPSADASARLQARIAWGDVNSHEIDGPLGPDNIRCTLAHVRALIQMENGGFAQAASILEPLVEEFPLEWQFAFHLGRCHHQLNNTDRARQLLQRVIELEGAKTYSESLIGQMELAEGNLDHALIHLFQAEQTNPSLSHLHCQIGEVYLRMDRYDDAELAFRKALDIDKDDGTARKGLGRALIAQSDFEAAADALLTAIQGNFAQPHAHYLLGVALAHLGEGNRAIEALQTCLAQHPKYPPAHRWLARVYETVLHDQTKADEHNRLAGELEQGS